MNSVETTASRISKLGDHPDGPGTAYLLVVDNDSSSIFHLPRGGDVVIGRAPEVELRVQHASVSRRHATIRIDDGVLRVADLGSHNGTRVNGEVVSDSRALASGDVVTVGDVVLVVHFSTPTAVARQTNSESAWRRRLSEELERAITFRRMLGVVVALDATPAAVIALAGAARAIDVVGTSEDGQTLLLLPEIERTQARSLAERALAAANAVTPVRAGLAICPSDAVDADTIMLAARSAARRAQPRALVDSTEAATRVELGERHVLIADPAMTRVFALLERLAPSELPVLINGETGVGKENAAYALHHWSKRTGPFIAVNCAALGPESLVDGELFGYDKGAFTGATTAKAGLFESAAGGTVLLDELGELPLALQAKLLRALESKRITRLGETRERAIDVRIVAATNRQLETEVTNGRFRQDLYFRISGTAVVLPPLRDRRCEIPVLAQTFLANACARGGRDPMTITPEAMQVLLLHRWPGNVRELRNVIDYVVAAAPDDCVEPSDLPVQLGGTDSSPAPNAPVSELTPEQRKTEFRPVADELRELERSRMAEALVAANGVKTRAAQLIDMPIRTFTLKLKQYKL
jgi:two-component system, NtrC family, response regulator AtoC